MLRHYRMLRKKRNNFYVMGVRTASVFLLKLRLFRAQEVLINSKSTFIQCFVGFDV